MELREKTLNQVEKMTSTLQMELDLIDAGAEVGMHINTLMDEYVITISFQDQINSAAMHLIDVYCHRRGLTYWIKNNQITIA
jgi:hypothetical protein